MSIYRITDVTPVGAYMNAMKARHDGDRREAERLAARRKSPGILRSVRRAVGKVPGLLGCFRDRWSARGVARNAAEPAE